MLHLCNTVIFLKQMFSGRGAKKNSNSKEVGNVASDLLQVLCS